jgi:hypothetical protein
MINATINLQLRIRIASRQSVKPVASRRCRQLLDWRRETDNGKLYLLQAI